MGKARRSLSAPAIVDGFGGANSGREEEKTINPDPLIRQTLMRLLLKSVPVMLIASLAFMPATPAGGAHIAANSDNGELIWARAFRSTDFDRGDGVFVDESGNVYTTGWFEGTVDFDPGPGAFYLTSAGDGDIFISKLSEGGDFLWAKRFGGTGQDSSNDIFMDWAGNLYTTGGFEGTVDFDPGVGVFNLTSAGLEDIFVSKLRTTYLVIVPLILNNATP